MDIIRNVFRNFNQTQQAVTSSITVGNNEDIIINEENNIFTQRIKAKQQYTHTYTHTQNNNNNNNYFSSSSFIKCPCYSISNYHQHHHSHIIPPPTEQQPLLHDPNPDVEYNSYRISFSPISRPPPLQTSTIITNNTNTSFLQQALFPSSESSPTTNEDTYRYYYNYAFDKKDTSNYPLFSYHNFLTIQQTSLNTSNYLSQLLYTNTCPLPLMSLYIDLLNQRQQQQQHSTLNDDDNVQYPFTQFITVDNYSTMYINGNSSSTEVIVVVLCDNRDCMWNVLEVFVDECVCNYYKCCKKEAEYNVIEKVLECVAQKDVKWSVNYVNVFKAIDEEEHNGVMPLIVMDYVARGRKCPAMCKNDLVYYSVLVGIELMDEKMYTYR